MDPRVLCAPLNILLPAGRFLNQQARMMAGGLSRLPCNSHTIQRSRHATVVRASNKNTNEKKYLTCPIVVETAEVLTKEEMVPSPLWSSFCGSLGGMWLGHRGVYAPFTGQAEPIGLDGKTKLYHVSQCCVEDRDIVDGVDCVVRHEAHASKMDVLEELMKDADTSDFERVRDNVQDWEYDAMSQDEDGLFIFDGGSYSRGPLRLCRVPDTEERGDSPVEDEYSPVDDVHVIESCLQWNGEERVRVSVTMSTELLESELGADHPPELDVSLLRVAVNRESWEGLPGQYMASTQSDSDVQSKTYSSTCRIDQKEMKGFWNVFDVRVSRVEDVDMKTGNLATLSVYTSQEFQRIFNTGDTFVTLDESSEGDMCVLDGGTLWLPHRVILQVSTPVGDEEAGLEVSMLWSPEKDKFLSMTRKYSKEGDFIMTTCSTGIKK